MRFADANILYGLWGLPLLALFVLWAARRKRNVLARFAERHLLSEIAGSLDERKQRRQRVLLVLVFVFSLLALARPQWGFQWREVKRRSLDILLAVDTSKSMLTQDVKPDRLARTKLAVRDLIKKLRGDRIGLIAFSGEAFLACPLTVDYGGFLLSLDDLDTGTIPRGGTDISAAVDEAIRRYDTLPGKDKVLIILTDGENLEGDPVSAAEKARAQGIKIYCVGIGTREGELIRVPGSNGQSGFLKDDSGHYVKSRLNEQLLQRIALTTGGTYVRASGAEFGLDLIYDRELSRLERRETESKMEKRYFERFQLPLGLALFFLLLGTVTGTRKEVQR